MHKSNRKSENLLLSRERAELLGKEPRLKAQCPRCYLQIDKNSFHVLGSQYQLQGVHVVLQEGNGKGIEVLRGCAGDLYFLLHQLGRFQ